MSVPLVDVKREVARYRETYLEATTRVFDSGIFSLGPEVQTFEHLFAYFLKIPHAVGVNGGTLALYAACLALDIGQGDEVIVPANSFIATAEAVVMSGATPRFCDVDPVSHLLDLTSAERLVTPQTRAIIPVHLYGQMVDMVPLMAFARAHGLRVIEDVAQAHGASRHDQRAGIFGDMGCFSFYPTKNLGALGEAGAIVTHDENLAYALRAIRVHGCGKEKYHHERFGSNLKMEALQAAYLSLRIPRLLENNARRRAIADRYRQAFQDLPLGVPQDTGLAHVYHLFVVTTDRRDALQAHLQKWGIGTGIHYATPIHLQPSFARWGGKPGDCPIAEATAHTLLSLPMFPELQDAEVEEVIAAVRAFFV